MAQTQVFRGVQTKVERIPALNPRRIQGFYRGTCVAQVEDVISHAFPESEIRRVTLNTGGWKSATTKMRMNQFANEFCDKAFSVFQEKGNWYVYVRQSALTYEFDKNTITFYI